jgi:hypothetical protein
MSETSNFTPQAARKWAKLGERAQTLLLNNVWCVACRKTTTIVNFTGRMEKGDIVLEGHCIRCDGPVARVIEEN